MKKISLIIFLLSISVVGACSSFPALILKFTERTYVLCAEKQMIDLKLPRNSGYACFRYCAKYKLLHSHVSKNCKVWETDVLDMTKREDFTKLRDANFVLRVEGK